MCECRERMERLSGLPHYRKGGGQKVARSMSSRSLPRGTGEGQGGGAVSIALSAVRQKPTVASTPHMRGSEIEPKGVPKVSFVMLFTPVTYWSSSTLVT
jgi:hypothetical protein